uniref:Mediator of DNA damage checkpoint protein 1 n=1 Tax=Syphacia muris TaxID=451379 RepID=A0A0N5AQG1_9BILA
MQTQEIIEHLFDDDENKPLNSELPVAFLEYDLDGNHYKIGLFSGETTVGRLQQSGTGHHILITDPTISGLHARITVSGERILISDLGSTNGTMINQVFLTERFIQYEAKVKDYIRFGSLKCFLSSEASCGKKKRNFYKSCEGNKNGENTPSSVRNKKDTSVDVAQNASPSTTERLKCVKAKEDFVSLLIASREKEHPNIFSALEPSSSSIYEFKGLGAEPDKSINEESVTERLTSVENLSNTSSVQSSRSCSKIIKSIEGNKEDEEISIVKRNAHTSEHKSGSNVYCENKKSSKRQHSSNFLSGIYGNSLLTFLYLQDSFNGSSKKRQKRSSLSDLKSIRVFFLSGFSEERMVAIVKKVIKIGASITKDIRDATHVVGVKVRRTTNFVCAVARRLPIVDEEWINDCLSTKTDNWDKHLLVDPFGEKRAGVVVKNIYREPPVTFLSGFKIYVTQNAVPSKDQVKLILDCAGAELTDSLSGTSEKALVLTSRKDYNTSEVELAKRLEIPIVECKSLLASICMNNAKGLEYIFDKRKF